MRVSLLVWELYNSRLIQVTNSLMASPSQWTLAGREGIESFSWRSRIYRGHSLKPLVEQPVQCTVTNIFLILLYLYCISPTIQVPHSWWNQSGSLLGFPIEDTSGLPLAWVIGYWRVGPPYTWWPPPCLAGARLPKSHPSTPFASRRWLWHCRPTTKQIPPSTWFPSRPKEAALPWVENPTALALKWQVTTLPCSHRKLIHAVTVHRDSSEKLPSPTVWNRLSTSMSSKLQLHLPTCEACWESESVDRMSHKWHVLLPWAFKDKGSFK